MKLEDIGKLTITDLLIHKDKEVRHLAHKLVEALLKDKKKGA